MSPKTLSNPKPISNKLYISSTTIIAALIFIVIVFIILYNSYIYPIVHQDKLQFTQELFHNYIASIKDGHISSNYTIDLKYYSIFIDIVANRGDIKLLIKLYKKGELIHTIDKLIKKESICFNDDKLNLEVSYGDALFIKYNYIYNRYLIEIKHAKVHYKGRFKVKCSNSPFICNSPTYKIFRRMLIDNNYSYDNIFGHNELSKITVDDVKHVLKNGSLMNMSHSEFIEEYLVISIINDSWILYFVINNTAKPKCYMIIKNLAEKKTLFCGSIDKKLKFFHNINLELNIGSNINELKFKFFSENIFVDFNSNNIKTTKIDDNRLTTSIDLSINYNDTLYTGIEQVFLYSNSELCSYNNLFLTI